MILEHFRIHNLFSYCGTWDFDLRPSDDGRNVLLIWGRNGYGKTSFLTVQTPSHRRIGRVEMDHPRRTRIQA